ncbi:MAG: hypothetical protein ACR2NL_00160 [Acidimicrobiia bacterium]
MVYAVVEIMALLVLAGLIGVLIGFGLGVVRTATVRRIRVQQKSKAELRHRLLEARQVISVLERSAATVSDEEEVFSGGIRLSERVAQARAEEVTADPVEIRSENQPVA